MEIFNAHQGSPEWLEFKKNYYSASEAASMLGYSKQTSRKALLDAKKYGTAKEFDAWFQKNILDKGHEREALARPNVEKLINDDLFPVVGYLRESKLLASFDGITMLNTMAWENKSCNKDLLAFINTQADLPDTHWPQVEQQLYVSQSPACLYTLSDDNGNLVTQLRYTSKPERLSMLLEGWKLFDQDIIDHTHTETASVAVGATMEALPALRVEVTGMVTASNLDAFKSHALACISGINTELTTDQDFADAEKAVKWCADVEKRLEAVKDHALSQTQTIDELFKTIDMIKKEASTKRLAMDKLIKSRKETIRLNIISKAQDDLNSHIDALNENLGGVYIQKIVGNFAEAIKGKKTLTSLQDAADGELNRARIDAVQLFHKIGFNLKYMRDELPEHEFLFTDKKQLVQNDFETLRTLCQARVTVYEADAAKKLAEKNEEIARLAAAAQYKDPEPEPLTPSKNGVLEKTDGAAITNVIFDESQYIFFPSDEEIITMLQTCYNKDRATIVARLKLMKL